MKVENFGEYLLLSVFSILNLVFGILNVFFIEIFPNFGNMTQVSMNSGYYLGIVCIIIGSVCLLTVIQKPSLKLWQKSVNYLKEMDRSEKVKKHKPKNAEDSMEILSKVQKKIDYFLNKKQYSKMIPYIEEKARIYDITGEFLKEIGMSNLINGLNLEKTKNSELLYDVQHNVWVFKYSELSDKIKKLQKQGDFSSVDAEIVKMLDLIEIRITQAKNRKNKSDSKKYKVLSREYKFLSKTNEAFILYRKNESTFNWIVKNLNKNTLSNSLSQVNVLQGDLDVLNSLIKANVSQNPDLANVLSALDKLLLKVSNFKKKIESHFTSILQNIKSPDKSIDIVSADFILPKLSKISLISLKTPLYAKVVLLGESSVGKTHLVLTMTERDYSSTQGSTVGVDKYFKSVKISIDGYDPQICFWDLGGQWNFRSINELFLNEAAVILLVYDVTRPETFISLQYWLEMIKKIRSPAINRLFVIGNKIDVGGNAIDDEELSKFFKINNLKSNFMCSAKTGEGVKVIVENIVGKIDWSELIKDIDTKHVSLIGNEIKNISNNIKICMTSTLLTELSEKALISDFLIIKAILRRYASQNIIQFGRSDIFTILDPEYIDKKIADLIQIASKAEGIIKKPQIMKKWSFPDEQFDLLLDYLVNENVCYSISKNAWVFPNVLHKKEISMGDRTREILESEPILATYNIIGPGDLIFNRLVVSISREIMPPEFVSNSSAYWEIGSGINHTVILVHFIPSPIGGTIRFRAGGGKGKIKLNQFMEIAAVVFKIYASKAFLT